MFLLKYVKNCLCYAAWMGDSGHLLAGTSTTSTMQFLVARHRWVSYMCVFFFVWSNNVVDVFCFWLEALIVDFVQVYPMSWTAIYVALDNVGMWNLRSEFWARQYLGQQLYLRVFTTSTSIRDEFPVPKNAILCGRASGRHTRPLWRVDASRRSILALEYEE